MTGDVLSGEDRQASTLAFIRALVNAWDCCGTCAGGVLAARDRERDAPRAVAADAARAELVARVLALADEWEQQPFRETRRGPRADCRLAAARDLRALVAPDHAETDKGLG